MCSIVMPKLIKIGEVVLRLLKMLLKNMVSVEMGSAQVGIAQVGKCATGIVRKWELRKWEVRKWEVRKWEVRKWGIACQISTRSNIQGSTGGNFLPEVELSLRPEPEAVPEPCRRLV